MLSRLTTVQATSSDARNLEELGQERNPFRLRWKGIGAAVTVACLGGVLFTLTRKDPGEYRVYAMAGERFLAGTNIYAPAEVAPFAYPPFFVLPVAPYAQLPFQTGRMLWNVTNILLLECILWILALQLVRYWGKESWKPALLATLIACTFVISPLEYQGHDYWVFLCVLGAIALWNARPGWSAVLAGLAAACKATPLLFLPILLVQGRFKASLVMCLALAGASLLPDLLVPSDQGEPAIMTWHRSFISKVKMGSPADADGCWVSWNPLNQSLAGTAYRIGTPSKWTAQLTLLPAPTLRVVILACQGLIVLLLGWCAHRFPRCDYPERDFDQLGLGGMVLAAMTLLSPMSSTAHFCVLLVPVTYLTFHWWYRRRDGLVAAALAVVFVAGLLTAKDLVGTQVKSYAMVFGTHTWATLACFLSCAYVLRRQYSALSSRRAIDRFPQASATAAAA